MGGTDLLYLADTSTVGLQYKTKELSTPLMNISTLDSNKISLTI